jgi:hypothetical protein
VVLAAILFVVGGAAGYLLVRAAGAGASTGAAPPVSLGSPPGAPGGS